MELLQQSEYRIGRLRNCRQSAHAHHPLRGASPDRNLPRRRADHAACACSSSIGAEVLENQGVAGFDPEAAEGVLSVAWWLHERKTGPARPWKNSAPAGKALVDLAPRTSPRRRGVHPADAHQRHPGERGPVSFLHPTEHLAGLYAAREPGRRWSSTSARAGGASHPRGGGGGLAGLRPEVFHRRPNDAWRRRARCGPMLDEALRRDRAFIDALRRRAKPERRGHPPPAAAIQHDDLTAVCQS